MITMMKKPSGECYVCGSSNWWLTPDGRYLCGRCHPNPNPDSNPAAPSDEGKYSSEVLALRDRVIKGNEKLNNAWEQIKGMVHDTEEWNHQMEQWHQANERLSALCAQLKAMGYTDCLYLENGKKMKMCLPPGDDIGCRVCPSNREYWSEELMAL